MKKPLLALIVAAGLIYALQRPSGDSDAPASAASTTRGESSNTALVQAFQAQRSNIQVEAQGVVVKTLADDNRGARHQRFIVALPGGQTVLVAHNIDLADRIDSLREGDAVSVHGEYEWNDKGGVIHWTHHDPRGTHAAGWIEHAGRKYQ